ncbi:kinesin-like protein KIF21A isoform X3 [Littorina saxatilis]|uniref:kinesin-like protein KIF21A isoform X3 n=1 Tax=Littorina saxatilis TaxID=31220 RepID=UPI0038B5C204
MTENAEKKEDDSSVRVALRVRPQNGREKVDMCQVCTSVIPNSPQVILGKDKSFTFDYVYDVPTVQDAIYNSCVRELIDGCFEGYNATVFAYGQTGSGKTYTMGTGFDVNIQPEEVGIIPRAVEHLFMGIEDRRRQAFENGLPPPDFKVNAQFMELYNEEIIDLLDTTRDPDVRSRKSCIRIHEDASGGIYCVGVTARPVQSLEDTIHCLKTGALSRTTASTNMNVSSSRSHAIFTLHIKQHRVVKDEGLALDDGKDTDSTLSAGTEFETLTAKFHFVDLAGSERLKRTGATGDRAKEGISINCGLLALGNVISALGDKHKKGSHVPYRDSKLTRLLQDSLGGNSRTLMIACISPSDRDFMETLNTLKYANRARNIKNKVTANQDKASRQIASLRAEIQALQQDLAEYKTGKRTVDADGHESINDYYTENSMMQIENDKLRQRIKALSEAVEALKTDNAQLMAESAAVSLMGPNGEVCNEDVVNQIKKYLMEIEDLKARLAESEATVEQLRRNIARSPRSPSRAMTGSSFSMMSSMMSSMGGFEAPASPEILGSALLEEAKRELKKMKKQKKRSQSKTSAHGSDKENDSGGEGTEPNGVAKIGDENAEHIESQEKSEDEDDETAFMDDEDEDEDEDEDTDSQSESDRDTSGEDDDYDLELENCDMYSDNIHEDLAELTCEISIKQRLIEDLERTQKNMVSMKGHYEDKVMQLMTRIKETEIERDTVLANLNKVEASTNEKTKKVKTEFEKKLSTLQIDLKKMQAAKREHAKMVKNNSHTEKQLKTLTHELTEMKKTKVKLMKQVKEEAERGKQTEARRTREVGQMKREQLKKETLIKNLEREKHQKDIILRRKQEEVEALRKRQKPISTKAAGRVGRYDKPPTQPVSPLISRRQRTRRVEFSPKAAKHKWERLEKHMNAVVTKKQTIALMECDMEVWLKQRDKTIKKLEHYQKKRKRMSGQEETVPVKQMEDIIGGLQQQVAFTQDNISECQMGIMQMEENKDEAELLDAGQMVSQCSVEEACYLVEHFLQLSIDRGLTLATKEAECRELQAKLHQTELNNTLQQDLLRHMMQDNVHIEADDLMTHSDADDIDSLTSSSSSSPADRQKQCCVNMHCMFESTQAPPVVVGIIPTASDTSSNTAATVSARKEKLYQRLTLTPARRKTATPEDLLYAGASEPAPLLLPVLETPEEEKSIAMGSAVVVKAIKEDFATVKGDQGDGKDVTQDKLLMPPPKSGLPRPASAKGSAPPLPSPSMRRRELVRMSSSPEPSPILRRKNPSGDRYSSHSSSIDTASDTTPPSSPPPTRRSNRNSDENVFSRLAGNTQSASGGINRGNIVSANLSRSAANKTSLLTCSHTAEGHTKAVLSVDATEDLLFTGSKDRTAKVWDLATGKELQSLGGHPNTVLHVKYCPETRAVFTVSQSAVRVWDIRVNPGLCQRTLSSSGLTTQGPASFAANRQVELAHREHNINDLAISRGGTVLYCAAGSVVQIWDLRRYHQLGRLSGHQAQVMALAVDTDINHEGNDLVISGSKDHYIKVFEVMEDAAGILSAKYNLEPPHYDGIQSLAVQGHVLFSGSRDTCIKKWDLSTQTLQQSINSAHKDWICALGFLPGSNALLSACRGGMLKLWSIDTFTQLAEIKAHSSPINAIATNSSQVFTASNDHTVAVWKPRSSQDPSDSSDVNEDRLSVSSQ